MPMISWVSEDAGETGIGARSPSAHTIDSVGLLLEGFEVDRRHM
ncbi:MAG: hypothetical protein VCB99_02290 [Myxococcota bacterium]